MWCVCYRSLHSVIVCNCIGCGTLRSLVGPSGNQPYEAVFVLRTTPLTPVDA